MHIITEKNIQQLTESLRIGAHVVSLLCNATIGELFTLHLKGCIYTRQTATWPSMHKASKYVSGDYQTNNNFLSPFI